MDNQYCVRCEIFDRRTKASRYLRSPLGELIPLCEKCIEEIKEENDIFTPSTILENE